VCRCWKKFFGSCQVVTKFYSQARTLEFVLIRANAPTKIEFFEYISIETAEGSETFKKLGNEGYIYVRVISQNILSMHSFMTSTK
jgi:hypothetical protein